MKKFINIFLVMIITAYVGENVKIGKDTFNTNAPYIIYAGMTNETTYSFIRKYRQGACNVYYHTNNKRIKFNTSLCSNTNRFIDLSIIEVNPNYITFDIN